MLNFDTLHQAMREWVHEAVSALSVDLDVDVSPGLRRWQRDADGVFRNRERPSPRWSHNKIATTRQLRTWLAVEQALYQDYRLRSQMDIVVGTIQGTSRFDAEQASLCVLPSPDEVSDLETVFARRYERLDTFLAARDIGMAAVWPVIGLTSTELPITLEQDVELDMMSDEELAAALRTQVLPLAFPGTPVLHPDQDKQACLRYRYRLTKVIGDQGHEEGSILIQHTEARLKTIQETYEQALALSFANPVAVSGMIRLETEWTPSSGWASFQPTVLTRDQRHRRLHLGRQEAEAVIKVWQRLRQPRVQQHKALGISLRRLSYQVGRERVEDEFVDILVAAEALYLSDGVVTELGFRLALRAAALSDPNQISMTRREIFDLMKSAYGVRSKVVHGSTPRSRDLKVRGLQVSLSDFVEATAEVVRHGLQQAVRRAADPTGTWPPDWDDLTLPR